MISFFWQLLTMSQPKPKYRSNLSIAADLVAWDQRRGGVATDTDPAADSETQKVFAAVQLKRAQQQAASLQIGESFRYQLSYLPEGTMVPRGVSRELADQAPDYGLSLGIISKEGAWFTRTA